MAREGDQVIGKQNSNMWAKLMLPPCLAVNSVSVVHLIKESKNVKKKVREYNFILLLIDKTHFTVSLRIYELSHCQPTEK